MSAFTIDSRAKYVRIVRPKIMREKYSGGPKLNATLARDGARNVRTTILSIPARQDRKAEIPRAGPPRPGRDIAWPSRQVTTDAASPGILTRMEVVEPPYIAP